MERQQFERVLFPIGGLSKPMVREIARRAGLPNHKRKDSTGICFIGEREFRGFLSQYLRPDPGPMEDADGRIVGEHRGLMYYTLGQRRGLAIGGQRGAREAPWYVIAKDPARNALLVSQQADHPRLMSRRIVTAPFFWVRRPESFAGALQARIRHRQSLQPCTVQLLADGAIAADFEQPQRAAAAGQYLVLYDGEECLGGGEIAGSESVESEQRPDY